MASPAFTRRAKSGEPSGLGARGVLRDCSELLGEEIVFVARSERSEVNPLVPLVNPEVSWVEVCQGANDNALPTR